MWVAYRASFNGSESITVERIGRALLVSSCRARACTLDGRHPGREVPAEVVLEGEPADLERFRAAASPDVWAYESPTFVDGAGAARAVFGSADDEQARRPCAAYVEWATTCRRCGRAEPGAAWAGLARRCSCATPDTPDPLV